MRGAGDSEMGGAMLKTDDFDAAPVLVKKK